MAAVLEHRWPAEDEALVQHAARCAVCADVVTVGQALLADYDEVRREMGRSDRALPSAGQVWYRAALRARADAVQSAARPLVWAYGLAGACAAGLTAAVAGLVWPALAGAFSRLEGLAWRPGPTSERASGLLLSVLQGSLPFVLAAALCLVVAPVAVYFAVRDDQKL